jgi:4-hydroxy-4-methyl-2-oxoglutarate aldolase
MSYDQESALARRLEACYSGAVFDVLRAMGYPRQVLPHGIRPLDAQKKLAGPVYTVAGHINHYLSDHETLIRWTDFLSRAPSGSVVICQPHDSALSHMGELSAETLHFRGVRGYIVDGGCRDTEFILQLGFPVFCRYATPADIVGRWSIDVFGEPITIGIVTIRTGDYVLADRDGVVILPSEIAGDVVTRTEEVMQTENLVRVAILAGTDPKEAYLKFGKF